MSLPCSLDIFFMEQKTVAAEENLYTCQCSTVSESSTHPGFSNRTS